MHSSFQDLADISHPEQSCNPSGRKRLKLLKPTKIIEKSSPNNKPSSCMLPELIANASSPDFLLDQSDCEQGNKQGTFLICRVYESFGFVWTQYLTVMDEQQIHIVYVRLNYNAIENCLKLCWVSPTQSSI